MDTVVVFPIKQDQLYFKCVIRKKSDNSYIVEGTNPSSEQLLTDVKSWLRRNGAKLLSDSEGYFPPKCTLLIESRWLKYKRCMYTNHYKNKVNVWNI